MTQAQPTVTVRPIAAGDRDAWARLFVDYGVFYETAFSSEVVEGVWTWLADAEHPTNALVAVSSTGSVVGFAVYRSVPDTFTAGSGWFLDDLFVDPAAWRGSGQRTDRRDCGHRALCRRRGSSLDHGIRQPARPERVQQARDPHDLGHVREGDRLMQLGTRWTVGAEAPSRLPLVVTDAVRDVEAELAKLDHLDTSAWRWTLTWLENKPVVELDDGTIIRYNAETNTAMVTAVAE